MPKNHPSENDGQIDLIELLLERQAELNALLEVTRAINSNVPSETLIEMLEIIMKGNLKIRKFRLLIQNINEFYCVSNFGGELESFENFQEIAQELIPLKIPIETTHHPDKKISAYDYFIPFYHKDDPLAFVLVGDFKEAKLIDNKVDYIQTLINVIIVAFENKKLFKERIHRERLQREVELAGQVQNMLIPQDLPNNPILDVESVYLPHQNIGGDFFDFIPLKDNKFLWCVADVSGKGISAALIMSNFQASLRALVSLDISLSDLITRLNQVVFNNTKGDRFITVFIGLYNQKDRTVKYVNAGHNASLIIQNNQIEELKKGTTMIGVFDELPFINEGEITIEKDAIVFNYTDGIIEFDGEEDQSLSEDELKDFLQKNQQDELPVLHQKLMKKISEMRNNSEPSDDITILTLKFH
ncbi:MAG: PP2C family protein-serine/threonine phosphatase [Bacteroidetes bacterium]|nr:PP2C family protein-serine/threonine phosphatase [Bacteroidota bacterium]MBU1371469.1 PP2C family protein-serine/threonine phosphatase [Bacteroidota bacterium]MBU1485699.1 PP2C family protein-serine/threonine phosphatase [Bacteroidota bacterium]MBU1761731.1 PP2C family protein-serine/threonine phosphatase [Bacteroidota bacterium]MBU2268952.1 PP2C family protein-serine/threonine phosphatase [Bacteroidota bacterium]